MAKGIDAGKAFLAGVLSKIPVDQRGEAERIFSLAEVATAVGDGTLAQSDYTRQLDDLKAKESELQTQLAALADRETKLTTWHEQLSGWKGQVEDLVTLGKAAKDKGWDPTKAVAGVKEGEGAGAMTEADIDKRMTGAITAEREAFLGFELEKNQLQRTHFDQFGKMLDIEPLLRHPEIAKVGLAGVYHLVHKDALEAKAKADADAAEAKIRADERAKVLASQSQMPYLTPAGAGSGSPLDAIKPTGGTDGLVDAATAEYQRLQAAREGAARA